MLNGALELDDVPDVDRHVAAVIAAYAAKRPLSKLSTDDRDDLPACLLTTA